MTQTTEPPTIAAPGMRRVARTGPGATGRRRRSRGAGSMLAQGQPAIWLTGGALVVSVTMIVGLLLLVLWQGIGTFWPVPVVEVQRESRYPGGAANVARNLTALGTTVELSGIYGRDPNGALLVETLAECGIGTALCLEDESLHTITKTRVVARHQQVVRIDREKRRPISTAQVGELVGRIAPLLSGLDGRIAR